ncbi:hypothetical protein G3I40_20190 [Streptomyces sp. SID14478]|nr:hypothetical protein [Streptomyces sp. SID14478]
MAVAVAGAVACRPVDGDLNPASAATTTDQEATSELNRQHAQVAWLSCSGSYNGRTGQGSSPPDEVVVDCRGKAKGGRDVTLKGWVYGVVPGKCVRGDFIARVDDKVWFHLQVLGNCAASDTTTTYKAPEPATSAEPAAPAAREQEPGPTRTVTQTVTVPAPQGK